MRSLASSITTLFPLITTIPILFCVFWGGNIQVKKLKCLQYKHTKVNVFRGCATYLFGELNGVIQHQVHEGVKTAESPFNLENISASNTSLKLFHHSSPTTDYLTSSSHTCTSSKLFHPLTSRPPLILRWTLLSMNFFNSGGWAFDIFPGLRGKSERIAGL